MTHERLTPDEIEGDYIVQVVNARIQNGDLTKLSRYKIVDMVTGEKIGMLAVPYDECDELGTGELRILLDSVNTLD